MRDSIIVTLSGDEQFWAKRDGKAMYDNKVGNGNLAPPVGTKRSQLYYDILGIAGEIAVHRYLLLQWNFELHALRDNGDLNLGEFCFDIKTVPERNKRFRNNWLEVPVRHTENPKKSHINAYILVNHLGGADFEIVGYTRRPANFFSPWQKHTYNGHEANPVYRLHREYLQHPSDLRYFYVPAKGVV